LIQRGPSNLARVFSPEHPIAAGHAPITVVRRCGTLHLSRQVFFHRAIRSHQIPSTTGLPPHNGQIIPRGLQEWAWLLSQELPFASVARLLGWQTHEAQVLGETTLRSLVRCQGQRIRQAEQTEVAAWLGRQDLATLDLQGVPHAQPRRRAGWPAELNAAVAAALAREQLRPPHGVSWADGQRVLEARRAEATDPGEELRGLGPKLEPDHIFLTVDEVLSRRPEAGHCWERRTARGMTAAGDRYLSGVSAACLQQLVVVVQLTRGRRSARRLSAEGARWIRNVFTEMLSQVPRKTMILDWHHLKQKWLDLSSRICRGKAATAELLRRLYRQLGRGNVLAAGAGLEAHRGEAKNEEKVDELSAYLQARAAWLPNYRQRRIDQRYLGSGHAEKANDVSVAPRQKNRGMQGSLETSDARAALRTLLLNGGWDRYWQQREILPLIAS
jgi:hypothetical protein